MSRLRDDIDQLTACMTTPGMERDHDDAPGSRQRPEIIVLLMGHLPVRAGLWRLPAARFLCPDSKSLIVAHQEEESLLLECVGGSLESLDQASLSRLEHLSADSKIVLVPDSNIDSERLADVEPDRIAIVTGGDQAAIVGAYSQLKSLKISDDLVVELVIVGAAPSRVDATANRLIDAASRHLNREIRFVGAIEKINVDGSTMTSCAVSDHEGGLLEMAARIRRGPVIDRPRDADHSSSRVVSSRFDEGSVTPGSLAQAMIEFESTSVSGTGDGVKREVEPDCSRLIPGPSTFVEPPRASVPSTTRDVPVTTAMNMVSGHEEKLNVVDSDQKTLLSSHLPGIKSLPVHCPICRTIELGIDDSGHLHLLSRDVDMSRIPAVQTWIREHQHLLQMAMPGVRMDGDGAPRVHVLGEDVDVLCGLRGTGWHPHLLVKVDESDRGKWTRVPLER